MAVIKSGKSSNLLTVGPTSKAIRVGTYNSKGVEFSAPINEYYLAFNAVMVGAGTNNYFMLRGSNTKTLRITRIEFSMCYTGTLAANQNRVGVFRIPEGALANYTLGERDLTPNIVKEKSTLSASTITFASDYNLTGGPSTTLSVGVLTCYQTQFPRSVTGKNVFTNTPEGFSVILKPNQGLLISNSNLNVGSLGDVVSGNIYWEEY